METKTTIEDSIFLLRSNDCLDRMADKAQEMGLKGVGLIALLEGTEKKSLISKMKVCGALKNKDANFLAIAYTKAGEMVDTLQNSGTTNRIPLLGEFNFLGGLIEKIKNGHLLVVFSGATGEEDTIIARAGLDAFFEKKE